MKTQTSRSLETQLTLLSAKQACQQARSTRIQTQAARLGDAATLYQALGGGWWNRSPADLKQQACNC